MTSVFQQGGYGVRLEWGTEGVAVLAPVCRVIVIVDVLSFSTAVDIAVGRGASVLPLRWHGGTPAAVPDGGGPDAVLPDGVVLAGRRGSTAWSLSPSSLLDLPAGTRLALASPNGATLSAEATAHGAVVLAGCLRNASAVAAAAADLAGPGGMIGVIPAGERWPDGRLRPAVEDLLGAGAVVAGLAERGTDAAPERARPGTDAVAGRTGRGADMAAGQAEHGAGRCSPEALAAYDAFLAARERGLAGVLAGCSGGRELAEGGYAADVALAAESDVSGAVPVLRDDEYGGYGARGAGWRA